MSKHARLRQAGLLALVMLLGCGGAGEWPGAVQAQANFAYNDPAFAARWKRFDLPVLQTPQPPRGYTWGFPVRGSGYVAFELYNATFRKVQYFDKARMEVNPAIPDPANLWHVTTGLIVRELVSGQLQIADTLFVGRQPSDETVAGDPGNPLAPTYAAFGQLISSGVDRAMTGGGSYVKQLIDHAGNVSGFEPGEKLALADYDPVTRHHIPAIFRDYAAQTGPVFNGSYIFDQENVFYGNWLYVFGRPLTEPLWTRAVVGGVEKELVVQLYERRVLTYTPSNTPANRVEMGNTGQHYFNWRYQPPSPAACRLNIANLVTKTPPAAFPADFSQATAAYNSSGPVPPGGAGNVLVYTTGLPGLHSPPALTLDGTLAVLAAGKAGIIGLKLSDDSATICEAWRYAPSAGTEFGATPLLYDGRAIALDSAGTLHAIGLADGQALWTNSDPLRLSGYGTPITDGNNLYFTARTNEFAVLPFGPSGGHLYAVNMADGKTGWTSPNISGAGGPVIFGFDGNLFLGGWDGQVYGYNPQGQPLPGWPSPHIGYYASGPVGVAALTFANNRLYAANGGIYALDRTGKVVDSNNNGAFSIPAIAGDTLYIGLEAVRQETLPNGQIIVRRPYGIHALNANNLKEEIFTFQTGFPNGSSPAVMDGYIYFWAEERFFQVKSDGSGQNRQLLQAGSGGAIPVVAGGRVYLAGSDGNFYIIR